MKRIACIITCAPYGTQTARDALNVVMACAAFDHPPDLFFVEDGILQLIKTQQAKIIAQKNIASLLQSLPLFDIDKVYLCKESVTERNIMTEDFILSPCYFEYRALPSLLDQYTVILTF